MVSLVDRICPFKDKRIRAWAVIFASGSLIAIAIAVLIITMTSGGDATGSSSDLQESGSDGAPPGTTSSPPSLTPSLAPEPAETPAPVESPSLSPSSEPEPAATRGPVEPPTVIPTSTSPILPDPVTYRPGELNVREAGLLLSEGLTARIIATAGSRVSFVAGGQSSTRFHQRPDYGACFALPDDHPEYPGGWKYISNSEVPDKAGGVGAVTFDRTGEIVGYEMLLTGTTMNCAGGRTSWNTFVSCEEVAPNGRVFQVDPYGNRQAEIAEGFARGRLEAFACDDRNRTRPQFFVTEDQLRGALRRFTPDVVDWDSPWDILHGEGTLEFMIMEPDSPGSLKGAYRWTSNHNEAKFNAEAYYPSSEGLDRSGNILFMTCKNIKRLFLINLDDGTYESFSTNHGAFDGTPDQVKRILADENHDILYFVEDQGRRAGIHGRNNQGQYFTILEELSYTLETTGLAFSPDGMFMYFCMQDDGLLFEVTRLDGLPFHGTMLDIRYHSNTGSMT